MIGAHTALGIDLGDDAIRLVVARSAGATIEIIHAARSVLAEGHTPSEVAEQLTGLLAQARVGRARVACGLPGSDCAVKIAVLPPAKPAELAQVVRFEAETQIPLPLGELVWGYTLAAAPDGRRHAVIVGVRQSTVDARLAVLQESGLTPDLVQPASLAVASTIPAQPVRQLLVIAGAKWTDLCLYHDERLLASRSVLAGRPEDAGWAARIARETRPWLAGDDRPETLVLCGNIPLHAAEELAESTALPHTDDLGWHAVSGQEKLLVQGDVPSAYAAALGLAAAALERRPALNLLPAQVTAARTQRRSPARTVAVLGLLALLLIPAVQMSGQALRKQQTALQDITRQVQETRRTRPQAVNPGMVTAGQVLDALDSPQSQPLELLREMSVALPAEVILSDCFYDRTKAVAVLKGRADSHATVARALSALADIALVERAMLDQATTMQRDGKAACVFQITCTLTASGDPTLSAGRQRNARNAGARAQ